MGKEHQATIDYILALNEPVRSLMIQLRELFLGVEGMTERFSWKTPFYFLNNTPFVYFSFKQGYMLLSFCWGYKIADKFNELGADDRKAVRQFKIEYNKPYNEEALIYYIEESIKLQSLYGTPFGKKTLAS